MRRYVVIVMLLYTNSHWHCKAVCRKSGRVHMLYIYIGRGRIHTRQYMMHDKRCSTYHISYIHTWPPAADSGNVTDLARAWTQHSMVSYQASHRGGGAIVWRTVHDHCMHAVQDLFLDTTTYILLELLLVIDSIHNRLIYISCADYIVPKL